MINAAQETGPHQESNKGISEMASDKVEKTSRNKWIFAIYCIVRFSLAAFTSLMAPFFPQLAASRGVGKSMIGIIFSCYQLSALLTGSMAGWLMPRVGPKFIYIAGLFVTGVCSLLFGFLDLCPPGASFIGLSIAIRAIEGIGASSATVVGLAVTTSAFKNRVASITGSVVMFHGIGTTAGPAIGGILYEEGGFGLPFWSFGIFLLLVGCFALFLPFTTQEATESSEEKETHSYLTILSVPMVLILLCFVFFDFVLTSFINSTLSLYLVEQFQLGPAASSIVFALFGVFFGILCFLMGRIGDTKIRRSPFLIGGFLLACLSLVFLGPAPFIPIPRTLWLTVPSVVLCGACSSVAVLVFPSILDVLGKRGYSTSVNVKGLVSGLRYSTMTAGGLIGPMIGGILTERIGFPSTAAVIGVLMLFPPLCMGVYQMYRYCQREKKLEDLDNHAPEKMPLLS